MTISRREVLVGTASIVATCAHSASAASAASSARPFLTPAGTIFVTRANFRSCPMNTDGWHRDFLPSIVAPPSQEQQDLALLSMYRALAEDMPIEINDLMSLNYTKWSQLVALGHHYSHPTYRHDDKLATRRTSRGHDREVCAWVDREVSQIVDQDWRYVPSAFATHRRDATTHFERAHDLYGAGKLDEATTVCNEVIERYGIEEEAGERALIAKFYWLEKAGRIEESEVVWDQVWRCLSYAGQMWGDAWRREGPLARRCTLEDMRVVAGVPEVDLSLGLSPNQRYRALTGEPLV
jgi:hypothetical protein